MPARQLSHPKARACLESMRKETTISPRQQLSIVLASLLLVGSKLQRHGMRLPTRIQKYRKAHCMVSKTGCHYGGRPESASISIKESGLKGLDRDTWEMIVLRRIDRVYSMNRARPYLYSSPSSRTGVAESRQHMRSKVVVVIYAADRHDGTVRG